MRAMMAKLRSRLFSKDEQRRTKEERIQLLELGSSPMILERYTHTIESLKDIDHELIAEVEELKNTNEILLQKVRDANLSNQRFSESISGLEVPEEVRNSLNAFANSTGNVIKDIGQSAYGLALVGENIKRSANEISNVTSSEIHFPQTEVAADIDTFEISNPDEDINEYEGEDYDQDLPEDPEDEI